MKKCGLRRSKNNPDVYTKRELEELALSKGFTKTFSRRATLNELCLVLGLNQFNFNTLKKELANYDKNQINDLALSLGLVSTKKLSDKSIISLINDYIDYKNHVEFVIINISSTINMLSMIDTKILSKCLEQMKKNSKKYIDDCQSYVDYYEDTLNQVLLFLKEPDINDFPSVNNQTRLVIKKYQTQRKKMLKRVGLFMRTIKKIKKHIKTKNVYEKNTENTHLELYIQHIEHFIEKQLPESLIDLGLILQNKTSQGSLE